MTFVIFRTIICAIVIVFLFCTNLNKCDDQRLDDTELLMTFLVHRHGDRTPVPSSIAYATDLAKVMEVVDQYGYGQLIDVGINRGYLVGKFLRQRYNELLSARYNKSEIFIRSTDSTRTKMTVLAAMSAVYHVEESWCKELAGCGTSSWVPVPYTTVPAVVDFNLAAINCPTYLTALNKALVSSAPQMDKYTDLLDRWSNISSFNLTAHPCLAYVIYDVYTSQISMNIPLPTELEEMFPEIEQMAGEAIDVLIGNEEYISLGAGVLLNKFLEAANSVVAGEDVPRVHVYSAHDVNVYGLMAITRVRPLPGVPKYGAVFALEVRKVLATGQFVVVPVYLKTPDKLEVSYPTVEGCDDFCDLSRFQDLVSDKRLNQTEWLTQCEWSADYDFDFSSVG